MSAAPQKTTTLRLRRIRFKSGGEIRVLPPRRNEIAERFATSANRLKADTDITPRMAGYALVAWSADGYTYIDWQCGGPPVTTGDIPRYVHDVLVVELARTWGSTE